MTHPAAGTQASGNSLKPDNYYQNWKWGNTLAAKWTNISRPDSKESSNSYEGEIKFRNCISFVNAEAISFLIYPNKFF